MPDRVVTYSFRGNFGNLGAGLTTMGRNVDDTARKLVALDRNGQRMRAGLTQLGDTGGRVGLVMAAGVAVAVGAAANFEQAMSNVQAATHETAENMELLRQAALDAGQATKFSATESAQAIEEMAKAGVSTADILGGGLQGALDLAAAGGLEVAEAAQIAATALTQFRLSGEDVPHVADLLAAGAGKAQGDVIDMSMALKQSGLVAAQMGVSIEETTGTLAAFASAGLLGSDAGTSFRTMLLRLANPTKESASLMQALGISAYDAQGNFVGMASIAEQLQVAFEGKTQAERDSALATIFGSDAIRAASVLYEQGAVGVESWTNKVNDQGYAAETAATKMDNLKGDLEQLGGALETAFIGAGGGAQGPFRTIVQTVTDMVNAFNDLPGPVKSATTVLAGVTAVVGGGLWFGSRVVRGVSDTRQALADLGITARTARGDLADVAAEAGRTRGALASLGKVGELVILTAALDGLHGKVKNLMDLTFEGDINRSLEALAGGQVVGNFDRLGDHIENATDSLGEFGHYVGDRLPFFATNFTESTQELLKIDEALAGMVESGNAEMAAQAFEQIIQAGQEAGVSASETTAIFEQYAIALDNLARSEGGPDPDLAYLLGIDELKASLPEASAATDVYAGSVDDAATANQEATRAIRDAMDAMREQSEAALGAFDAQTQYRRAMKAAAEQAKNNNAGIKGNSDAALENRDRLSALAAAWNGLDNKTKNAAGAFRDARQNFIDTATAMGVPKKAAEDLADAVLNIPKSRQIKISADTGSAVNDLSIIKSRLDALKDKDIYVNVHSGGRPMGGPAPETGQPRLGADRGRASSSVGDALRSAGINTVVPRTSQLRATAEAKAAAVLAELAKNANEAGDGAKGLKARLQELEQRLDKASRAADRAHDALDSLRDQRAGLASSVSGALTHDPFSGSLETFAAQTGADQADAEAMLQALRTIIGNGIDPRSPFFQQLAASGNVALAQQFAALSRAELANYAYSFAASQSALAAVGQFAGDQAFGQAIRDQVKVTDRLDGTVKQLSAQVRHLEKAIDRMGDKVKQGAKDGSREGAESGTRAGFDERNRVFSAVRRAGR